MAVSVLFYLLFLFDYPYGCNINDMGTFTFHITQFGHALKTIFEHL